MILWYRFKLWLFRRGITKSVSYPHWFAQTLRGPDDKEDHPEAR